MWAQGRNHVLDGRKSDESIRSGDAAFCQITFDTCQIHCCYLIQALLVAVASDSLSCNRVFTRYVKK